MVRYYDNVYKTSNLYWFPFMRPSIVYRKTDYTDLLAGICKDLLKKEHTYLVISPPDCDGVVPWKLCIF